MDRIRHILVASDLGGSTRLLHAHAAAVARAFEARVTLLHVDELVSPHGPDVNLLPEVLDELGEARARALQQARRDLEALGVQPTLEVRGGAAREEIVRYAEAHRVDLIVIGRTSRPRLAELFIGSTAHRVVRLAPVPVLVVPGPDAPDAALHALPRYDHVVAATDLGETSRRGLAAVDALVGHFASRVTAIYCLTVEPVAPAVVGRVAVTLPSEQLDELMDTHRERIANQVAGLGRTWVEARVVTGAPAQALLDAAADLGADLVAVPSTGKGALERILLGSTTERLLRRSRLPVLVLPPVWLERWATTRPATTLPAPSTAA